MAIWEFESYREYLSNKVGAEGERTGLRKKLAEAISVHTTFVSQVFKHKAEFSLEQAESINRFLGHTEDEGEYFILLLLKDRAGSELLKNRFKRKIKTMRDERLNIKKRLDAGEISERDRDRYYSSYLYSAIHVMTAIPQYSRVEALAEGLRLPISQIKEFVEFMVRVGVLEDKGGKLSPTSKHVHLGSNNELVLRHHTNWRFHTISSLQMLDKENLHYSACMSLAQDDAFKVKESLLQNLKANVALISDSREEVPYVLSFDFYRLIR